ncbi:hypothetical protein LA080_011149 [Diaporthe eres]|nr:hypothetical protein LA080_011149 [Diaporthe eres]
MDDVLSALRQALGFHTGETSQEKACQPYIEYIKASWTGRGERKDFLSFFVEVVRHFRGASAGQIASADSSIRGFLNSLIARQDHYYFKDTIADSSARESRVNETVLLILGTWLLSQSYFVPAHQDQRRIVYAYCRSTEQDYSEVNAFEQTIGTLVSKSGLLPNAGEGGSASDDNSSSFRVIADSEISEAFPLHSSANLLESLSIDPERLIATNLSTYSHVEIAWTHGISRHMLLSRRAESYYMEIFALPCALQGGAESVLSTVGISTDLIDEIECSYATLFNPSSESQPHKTLAWVIGLHHWCQCLYCSAYRFRKHTLETLRGIKRRRRRNSPETGYRMPYDDQIRLLMERNASPWNQTDFKNLWPRILVLDSHLQRARPWNFWVLFRDRRDTVQYWTFLFGTVILVLTLAQVMLSIAQVVTSF